MNYKITLLSPLHIGTGKKITPFEFAFVNKTFVVMHLETVLIGNPSRAEDLNRELDEGRMGFSLSEFLTAEEKNTASFWKYSAALDASTQGILEKELSKAGDMDVDECLKTTTDYQVYIPGSSIKGALRTALAYTTFQADKELFQQLKNRLVNVDWRYSDEAVNDLIFWGARKDPKYDLFKTLRLSDSATLPATEETLEIGRMKILSLASSGKRPEPKGTMYAQLKALELDTSEQSPLKQCWTMQEVLAPGLSFSGQVEIETRFLQEKSRKVLGWKAPHQRDFRLESLILAANTFARDICDWELQFWGKHVKGLDGTPVLRFYTGLKTFLEQVDDRTCYLCLGSGAGWNKMSVGMLLERDPRFDFKKLRKTLRLAHDRLNFEYPKSRKLLMKSDDEVQDVFGWVKIQFS